MLLLSLLELVDELLGEEVGHVAVDFVRCQVPKKGVLFYGAVVLEVLVGAMNVAGCVQVRLPIDPA